MPPPGGKNNKAAEERFANFMTSTAGGTQGSSSYGGGGGSSSSGPGGMTFNEAADAGIMSQQEAVVAQAQENFQNQQQQQQQQDQEQGVTPDLVKKDKDKGSGIQNETIQKILFGTTGDPTANIKDFQQSGKHPLRAQLDYLRFKYGDSFLDTEQAKVLMGYLSGVPVERGGGLGARSDETDEELIGPTNVDDIPIYDPITGEFRNLEERQALADAAKAREDALNQFAGIGGLDAAEGATSTAAYLKGLDPEQLRLGLNPDQYFRFRQQLMAADPTSENQLYKDTFPFSSGAGIDSLTDFLPYVGGFKKFVGGMFPERNLTGYQQNIDDFATGFQPLPVERDEGIMRTNVANRYQTGDPADPADPADPNPTLPITTPQNPSTRFPDSVIRDYTQLGLPNIYGNQQMPNYATFNRAGSMPVGLQDYLDNLRKRFGVG
jgi:hypothetical protein